MEIWKNYNDRLEISNLGNVRLDGIAKPYNGNPKQYRYVGVGNRRSKTVHTIVYQLFGNMPYRKDLVINHKDGDIHNNSIENLELVSYSENSFHAYRLGLRPTGENHSSAKLSDDDVLLIRVIGKNVSQSKVAKMFGVGQQTISRILRYESRA